MEQEELMNQIADIEREIAMLPEGSVTKKKITIIIELQEMEIDLEYLLSICQK